MGLKGHRPGCPCVGCSPATRRRGMLALRANPRPRVRLAQRGTAFVLGKHSPFKGRVKRVNPRREVGTFAFEGREYSALGSVVTPTHATGYPHRYPDGRLVMRTWNGVDLGPAIGFPPVRRIGFGGVPFTTQTFRAFIEGRWYSGSGGGLGMLWRGRAMKRQPAAPHGNPATPAARRFRDVRIGSVFEFAGRERYPFSGFERGPWVKLSARTYRAADPGHRLAGHTLRVGSVLADVATVENPATPAARRVVSREIRHLERVKGYPPARAVAAALDVARRKGYRSIGPRPNARPRYWVVSSGSEGRPVVRGPFDFWPDTVAPVRSLRGRGFAAVAVEAPSRAAAIEHARPALGMGRHNPLTRRETAQVLRHAARVRRAARTIRRGATRYKGPALASEMALADRTQARAQEAAYIAYQWGTGARRAFLTNPPRVVGSIPGRMGKIFYNRTGKYRGPYVHKFGRGVQAFRLSDGSVLLRGPRPLWVRQD